MGKISNGLFLNEQDLAYQLKKKQTRKHRAKRQMDFYLVKLCIRKLKGAPGVALKQRPLKINLANTAVLSHAVLVKYMASAVDLWDY